MKRQVILKNYIRKEGSVKIVKYAIKYILIFLSNYCMLKLNTFILTDGVSHLRINIIFWFNNFYIKWIYKKTEWTTDKTKISHSFKEIFSYCKTIFNKTQHILLFSLVFFFLFLIFNCIYYCSISYSVYLLLSLFLFFFI